MALTHPLLIAHGHAFDPRTGRYQKQDLAFMIDQEQSKDSALLGSNGKRGGILADEMGACAF